MLKRKYVPLMYNVPVSSVLPTLAHPPTPDLGFKAEEEPSSTHAGQVFASALCDLYYINEESILEDSNVPGIISPLLRDLSYVLSRLMVFWLWSLFSTSPLATLRTQDLSKESLLIAQISNLNIQWWLKSVHQNVHCHTYIWILVESCGKRVSHL